MARLVACRDAMAAGRGSGRVVGVRALWTIVRHTKDRPCTYSPCVQRPASAHVSIIGIYLYIYIYGEQRAPVAACETRKAEVACMARLVACRDAMAAGRGSGRVVGVRALWTIVRHTEDFSC
jgi:hypothetical protein